MGKKKKRENESVITDILLLIGVVWLLVKAFKTPKQAGISGLPNAKRKLMPYINSSGIDEIQKDMLQFDRNEIGEIIRIIIEARLRIELLKPFWKTLKGTIITGEFRIGQWRIMVYIINNFEYLILNIFKKKTNETPQTEIIKAERRLKEYLKRKRY